MCTYINASMHAHPCVRRERERQRQTETEREDRDRDRDADTRDVEKGSGIPHAQRCGHRV